jgi:hypothetical protein
MHGKLNVKFTGICLRKIGETTDLRIFGSKVVNPTPVLSQLQNTHHYHYKNLLDQPMSNAKNKMAYWVI